MVLSSLFRRHKSSKTSKHFKETDIQQTETASSRIQPQPHQEHACEAESEEDVDSIPRSETEAEDHIAEIRAEKGLHGTDSNTADLQAALVVLSDQLYHKSTHFLLELVQNADDNSYSTSSPTLNITYQSRTLRIDCNEIGFSKKNVAAICRIGRSSKSGLDNTRRYIGEKGIGFKSVFKVSDVVWIQSGHYSFKFDKSARLGMIAPIWTAFPAQKLPGFTSILLKLSNDCDLIELIREIKALDPRLLIFLQKLTRANIRIVEGGKQNWGTSLELYGKHRGYGSQQHVTLRQWSNLFTYKIFRLQVDQLPQDPKRPDITKSEIILAFPVNTTRVKSQNDPANKCSISGMEPQNVTEKVPITSRIESQNVYAFLPIRDYGFKFLLQADFLLIASREDIDSSSEWNAALLRCIPTAFHRAIEEFNGGDFRYSWLPYLPCRPYVADFFRELQKDTLGLLCRSRILESVDGVLRPPSELVYVPDNFTDKEGNPLILTNGTSAKYLCSKYPPGDRYRLLDLGVQTLSTEMFIGDLRDFISQDADHFQEMSEAWHSRLAHILLSAVFSSNHCKENVSALKIVPLRDGRWVAPKDENLFFPSRSEPVAVPKGIEVVEIDPKAEADNSRRQLFSALGAKEFRADQICEIIIRTQENPQFEPEMLPKSDLISQAVFLYKTGWKNSGKHDIWFITETDFCRRGSQIYMDSDVPYAAKEIFSYKRSQVSFLHQDYYKLFSSDASSSKPHPEVESWQEWLVEHLHVAQIPRLATPSIGVPFSLSHDFEFLLNTCSSRDVLLLMRHHWKYYSEWIVARERRTMKDVWELSQKLIRSKISSMDVQCRRGLVSPLCQAFLPLSSVQLESFVSVPILDVPEPDDDQWDYLRHFGVVVELEAGFFVECLGRLKNTQTWREQVSQLYGELDHWTTGDSTTAVRQSFETDKLIFIPAANNESGGTWVHIDTCVWSGPDCLRATLCLEKLYPERERFFRETLRLGDADIRTLVHEARKFMSTDSKDRIAQVLVAISKYLKLSDTWSAVQPLATCHIFPVVTGAWHPEFDSLCSAAETDMWFIADRPHLKESFEGLVPLVALDTDVVENIKPFIDAMGCEHRVLSRVAKGVSKADGRVELSRGYTKSLSEKARCIARLVPKGSHNRINILRQIQNIEVYQSEKVIVEWVVTSPGGKTNYGRAESGRVALSPGDQRLKIFLTEEDINAASPPLELQEELAKFGEITESRYLTVLLYILMQDNLKSIVDTLQRQGIENDIPEFDNAIAALHEQREHPQNKKPPSQPNHGKFRFQLRRKPCHDEESSRGLATFIRKVERVSNLKKKSTEPWGASDVAGLLSRICRIENQDAALLLPQGPAKNNVVAIDRIGTMVDLKTGLWKETVIREEEDSREERGVFETFDPGNLLPPRRDIVESIDEEIQYVGELSVSKFLETLIGKDYSPSSHWTSCLRSKAGHIPYEDHHLGRSTFTITANSDAFTKLLVQRGYAVAESWGPGLTYHIKVVASNEGLLSKFYLDPVQVKKAQDCSMLYEQNLPKEIFALISVYNILTDPEMALFVDPWEMHAKGSLLLRVFSPYHASFKDTASAILLQVSSRMLALDGQNVGTHSGCLSSQGQTETAAAHGCNIDTENGMYSYQRLRYREIRLLELFPGQDDTPLKGTIHHVSIDSPRQYWAISYVWGNASMPSYFHTVDGKVPITLSLHGALQGIRDKENSIFLWADAICIDQKTSLEKRIQIRHMRKIFQSAEGVLACLGDAEDHSDRAIEALLQIRMLTLKPDVWPESLPAVPLSWAGRNLPSLTDTIWKDIDLLLKRKWFRRSWIVQELVLAENVMIICGRWTLNWEDFFEALKICRDEIQSEMQLDIQHLPFLNHIDPAYALGLARHSRLLLNDVMFSQRYKLLELLDLFAYTEATRERDKIFALLSLASDCNGKEFDPDYDSSMESIVRRYAEEFVRNGHAMDLLYRAGISKSYPFCSWIPYWTRENFPKTIYSWRSSGGSFCAGGKDSSHAQVLQTKPPTLVTRGIYFDTIDRMGETKVDRNDIISFLNSIYSSIDKLRDYPTSESRQELKLRLPIGNARQPHLELTNILKPTHFLGADSKQDGWPSELRSKLPTVESIQDMMTFLKKPQDARQAVWKYWQTAAAFTKRISNGTFCHTGKGYIGLVPGDTKVGDEVCILRGGAVPFVLRKDGSVKAWKLVGEGYIHGIMHGEALSCKHVQEQEFHIV